MQKERNCWLPSWHSKEQTQAWQEMPLGPMGWIAPPTEIYREKWKAWWGKWGKLYPYPPVRDGYKLLDAAKAKVLPERYPDVNN